MKKISCIKYDGDNSELFKKISADGLSSDAQVVVPETHNAILIKDGVLMETLNSGSYSIFNEKQSKKSSLVTVDVIYLSKTAKLKVMWGTKTRFQLYDPVTDVPVRVGAHGEFEVQIGNPRKAYMELIGAEKTYTVADLKDRLSLRMLSRAEGAFADAIKENNIPLDRLGAYKDQLAAAVLPAISRLFEEDYGLKVFSFTIADVVVSDEDIAAVQSARKDVAPAVCAKCGKEVPFGAKFCPYCGEEIGGKTICPACGAQNPPEAKFCISCGKKLKK